MHAKSPRARDPKAALSGIGFQVNVYSDDRVIKQYGFPVAFRSPGTKLFCSFRIVISADPPSAAGRAAEAEKIRVMGITVS